jgi:hypothetical protein
MTHRINLQAPFSLVWKAGILWDVPRATPFGSGNFATGSFAPTSSTARAVPVFVREQIFSLSAESFAVSLQRRALGRRTCTHAPLVRGRRMA